MEAVFKNATALDYALLLCLTKGYISSILILVASHNNTGSVFIVIILTLLLVIVGLSGGYFFLKKTYTIVKKTYLAERENDKLARLKALDLVRAEHLADLKNGVDKFYNRTLTLPNNYTDIVNFIAQGSVTRDPITNKPYVYEKTGDDTYQLCATYETAMATGSAQDVSPDVASFSAHPQGNHCYALSVFKARSEIPQSNQENLTSVNVQTCTDLPDLPKNEGIKITGIYETSDSIFMTANRAVNASIEYFNFDNPSQRQTQTLPAGKSFSVRGFSVLYPKVGYKFAISEGDNKVTSDSILFEGSKIRIEDPRCSSSYPHLPSF